MANIDEVMIHIFILYGVNAFILCLNLAILLFLLYLWLTVFHNKWFEKFAEIETIIRKMKP